MFLNVFEFDIFFPLWQGEKFAERGTLYLEIGEKELQLVDKVGRRGCSAHPGTVQDLTNVSCIRGFSRQIFILIQNL